MFAYVVFPWNPENLSDKSPIEGPRVQITLEMTSKTISTMGMDKAACASGIAAEMLKPAGEVGVKLVRDLMEDNIREDRIPI